MKYFFVALGCSFINNLPFVLDRVCVVLGRNGGALWHTDLPKPINKFLICRQDREKRVSVLQTYFKALNED